MTARSPAQLRARSLALHAMVIEKVRRQPELLARASETLQRWHSQRAGASASISSDWYEILASGMDAVAAAALETSDRGDQLRSASPLTAVLSDSERREFFEHWNERPQPRA